MWAISNESVRIYVRVYTFLLSFELYQTYAWKQPTWQDYSPHMRTYTHTFIFSMWLLWRYYWFLYHLVIADIGNGNCNIIKKHSAFTDDESVLPSFEIYKIFLFKTIFRNIGLSSSLLSLFPIEMQSSFLSFCLKLCGKSASWLRHYFLLKLYVISALICCCCRKF